MKVWKAGLVAVMLMMMSTLFVSCLEGPGYKPVSFGYFTIKETTYSPSGLVLIQDMTGYKFYPSKTSVEALGGLKELERAFLEFTFQEGESFVAGKTEYHIDLVNTGFSFGIATKDLCNRQDTLKNDSVMRYMSMWAYGGYVTAEAQVFLSDKVYIDMKQDRISNDTLYLHLNQNLSPKKPYSVYPVFYSFHMPDAATLLAGGIQPKEDSIVVAVSANVAEIRGSKIEYKYSKYKLE